MAQTQTLGIEGPSNCGWRSDRKIRRVPEVLLREERNRHDYIPKVVSIGPYHHGKPELGFAESSKSLALKKVLEVAGQQEDMCLEEIKKEITEIRECYEDGSTNEYSDDQLARMMLLDACFIMVRMVAHAGAMMWQFDSGNGNSDPPELDWFFFLDTHFGPLSTTIALRDMCLVENQIPLWIVEILLPLGAPGNEGKVLRWYLIEFLFGKFYSAKRTPRWNHERPFHLLEGLHRLLTDDATKPKETRSTSHVNCCFSVKERTNADLVSDECCWGISRFQYCLKKLRVRVCKCRLFKEAKGDLKILGHSFRSLTELKAKGIHLKPSLTQSLRDVEFKSSFMYAELQLPALSADIDIKTLFLNMMCYELDPQVQTSGAVVSYINLMKLLIVKPDDAKELREKKILLGLQGNDEDIVKMYQDLNTHGANNPIVYQRVKDMIQAHCDSKANTWMAELIHTYFRSPWTFITLLAATCLLVLTTLQTVYTMKS